MDGLKKRARPCDACRRRKIRCLFAANDSRQCVLCQSRATECTFVESAPRKKRLSYTREASNDNSTTKPVVRSPGSPPATPIHDYSSLSGPTLLKRTLGHQNRQSCSYFGLTSEHDPSIINLYPFDQNEECQASGMGRPGVVRRVNSNTHYLMRVDTPSEMEQELADLDQIEATVKPHGPALVNLYFRIVHPSFPIIHKKVFLEKYSRTYRVYLLAMDWWSYSRNLASFTKPNIKELESLTSKMMANMHLRPKISDIQACLVLSQRSNGDSWARTGLLVSMAQMLGVHLDCTDWAIPQWEKGVRKRIAWALFMQDKWGSLIYGHASHLTWDNWEVQPLEDSDFPETAEDDDEEEGSSEIEVGKQMFLSMISLTEIVADMLHSLFSLKIIRSNLATNEVLERAKPLQLRLKQWYAELPASLSMGETKARKLSSNGYLHLSYFAAETTLHRAVIRSHNVPGLDEELRLITRNAAKVRFTSAVDFIKRLRSEHLQSFWYFTSKLNLAIIATFGIVLWITSSAEQEREFYASQLAEYRWMLRVSSTSAEFMKYTVTQLDVSSFLQQSLDSSATASHPNDSELVDTRLATFRHTSRATCSR
ncbi:hypothetical protein BT63DRAFT_447128 [Microthyrium microscopicum]|uniref:Zn(2)-C6 fungal-type domain-containing protein n=1 Tax=Microthyrium microscopicum TaxID=703497 RepID=A0A6A6U7S3_9PEZI|nr:hypothetical protein BT63DRAFT_447128 [Microthyrium microscopicum]